jgi:hypothetical protein
VAVHAVIARFHPRKRKVWRRWPIYLVLLVLGTRSEIPGTPEPPVLRSLGILDHESDRSLLDDGGDGGRWQVAHIRKIRRGLIVISGQHEFQDHRAISNGAQHRQIASRAERAVTVLHPAKHIRGVVDEHRTMEPIIRYAPLIGLATIAIRGSELGNPGASIAHACVMRPPEVDVALCLQELVKTGLILVKSKGHRTGQGHGAAVCRSMMPSTTPHMT